MKAKSLQILMFYFLAFGCRETNSKEDEGISGKSEPQKITVYSQNVYDLSGYSDEGGGDPYKLFDENSYVDPRHETSNSENYIPTTNCQPTKQPAIYFPIDKGSRIVADLTTSFQITEVYLYDRSSQADSVWIYTGTMQNWKLRSAFTTVETAGSWGWRKFSINDSSRYFMIRFSNYETSITEMVIYGKPFGLIRPPEENRLPEDHFTSMTIKEFLGVNYFNQVDPKWLKPFHYSRLYSFAQDYDDSEDSIFPGTRFNMLKDGYFDASQNRYSFFPEAIKKEDSGMVWRSIMGKSRWMDQKVYKDLKPVTQPGMDPEDPLSYGRHASMMWNMAAFFGHKVVDSNLQSLSHEPKRSGLGLMELYENGNEDDAVWIGSKYCNPLEYFARSSADYDGHEGALGGEAGIIQADSGSRLMSSGLIETDTNRIRIYKFLCETLRKDRQFIWKGGIQYHHYSTNGKNGISPEEDSMRSKLSRVFRATQRIEPGAECILGENGYDRSQRSRQSVPLIPGISEEECQGIFLLRSINATAFSGFDAYILYWLRDAGMPEDPSVYMTSGIFRQKGDKMEPLTGWFYISSFVSLLANYAPDRIISENGKVWVYRYRNKVHPDSLAYFCYCPSHNGSRVDHYLLPVTFPNDGQAFACRFEANSVKGSVYPVSIRQGSLDLTVEERPEIVLVREGH